MLVDGRPLGADGAYRGFGRYLRGVLGELATRADIELAALVAGDGEVPAGVEAVRVTRRAPGRWADREHDLRLSREIRRHPSDVFHGPGHDPPRRCDRPWAQTLHDVIPLTSADPAYTAARQRWRRLVPRFQRADAVITNSHHTAREGVRVLGLDPARVHVAHLGVDARFTPGDGPGDADPPYVLLVAEHGPNKGFAEAFAVIGRLADAGFPHHLRVVGRLAPWVEPHVAALRAGAARPDRIDLLGWVTDEDLLAQYRGATALLVTSRAEGFGLPAVEAMACATPVVAFANSAVEEVVGDGGVLVPDGDVAAVADHVAAIATTPALVTDLRGRAVQRAAGFTWSRCADVHAEVFAAVAR